MNILITGGAGYVGTALVPALLQSGHSVTVLDLMIYGEDVLEQHPKLIRNKGDIRDQNLLKKLIPGHDAVIHLACISNDPSFELNPDLGKSINYDSFEPMVQISRDAGVERFIYASSSSVYGLKDEENVNETMSLEPLTDYSKFKAMCEEVLLKYQSEDLTTVTIRPATVCGYAPRQRLDVIVNILTNHAVNNGKIKIFGGEQKRPNIHIQDMVRAYLTVLEAPAEMVNGEIFNVGYENQKVRELAEIVKKVVGPHVKMETVPTDDDRSYHISSEKISKILGFKPIHTIDDAVLDLVDAFNTNKLPDSISNSRYYNIKRMQELNLV